MNAFFAMGGYGAYIWPSYGATLLVLGMVIAAAVRAHIHAKEQVRRLEGEDLGDYS